MLEDIKKEIIKFGKIAGEKNLSPGISGNISVRIGDNVVITATGSANGFLNEDDVTVIDFNGNIVDGTKKASNEKKLHIEFYKKRTDINAICHFHSPAMTAFAIAQKPIDEKVLPDIVYYYDEIPLADYALPGSDNLVEYCAKFFDKYDAVIMKNHGFIVGGENLKDAFLKADTCETYAKTLLLSKILGGAKMLNEEQIKEIHSLKL